MPLVEIKDFNELIDNKPFFDQPVRNKISRNNDYTTGNVVDYSYHQNNYELIDIDLSRQTSTTIPQQINFIGKLEEDEGAIMLFIAEKQQKTILNLSLDS